MKRPSLALVALFWTTASIFAQKPQLAIAKLEAPVYPPMALAARVWGDVILNVTLASDGSANAVTVESGAPMLRQAAINSATRSQFQANPENRTERYRLVFRFVLDQTTKCENDDSYPSVKHETNLVTISEQNVPTCDPSAVRRTKVRSKNNCGSFRPRCGLRDESSARERSLWRIRPSRRALPGCLLGCAHHGHQRFAGFLRGGDFVREVDAGALHAVGGLQAEMEA